MLLAVYEPWGAERMVILEKSLVGLDSTARTKQRIPFIPKPARSRLRVSAVRGAATIP